MTESMDDYKEELEASFHRYYEHDEDEADPELWGKLKEWMKNKENITVEVEDVTKAGVTTHLEGVRAFIPASKLTLGYVEEEDLPKFKGKNLQVRIITADEEQERLVLSAKDILREKEQEEKAAKIAEVEVGSVVEGTVETIKPYGAFVRLDNGLDGLLHISQISQKRIKSPHAVLSEGQKVTVKIIGNKDGRLSLSMKVLQDVMEEDETEHVELPEEHEISTNLGSLFANLKL